MATTAIVVLAPGIGFTGQAKASGGGVAGEPKPPNSAPISNGAAQKCGPSPTVTRPSALTATSAATRRPVPSTAAEALPSPPLRFAVRAPSPAPTEPIATGPVPAFAAAAKPRSR